MFQMSRVTNTQIMPGRLTQNEVALANITFSQRNAIIAIAAIVAALPKGTINREAVRRNIASSQLFGAIAGKEAEVKEAVEKLVDQILGPE